MTRTHVRAQLVACLAVTMAIASAPAAVAQSYFGQNKVQYKTFKFEVLHTDHFDIYFYPEERAGVELAARMAERWNERLSRVMQHDLSGRQPLILYASSTDFQQTTVVGGEIGEGTGGVTEGIRRRIVLPFAGPLADTDHVIGHELVHAYQYDIAAQLARGPGNRFSGIENLPLWFIEGMAEYLSIGSRSPMTAMWVRDAVAREKLPSISDLDNPKYFPYRWGQALWAYIGGRWGDRAVRNVLTSAIRLGSPDKAFQAVLGVTEKDLSADWQDALRRTYAPLTRDTTAPGSIAQTLTPGNGLGNRLNVSPTLSPDGRLVAFLSERSLFSVDLYVADAATGKVVRKLTSTAVDPHFSSLQFISSAGTWDPKGERLAVAAVADGHPVLAIYDVRSGDRDRELRLPNIDAALNPAWSPDGAKIALVGMTGGLTDLFLVDVASGGLTRLTSDPYAELHPAWSPDGGRLAFATDRFTSDLDKVSPGELRVGVLTLASKAVAPVMPDGRGKQINPQWSADGEYLYFVADPDGIANIYRVAADGGNLSQVTDLITGVSGITESSPALAAAGSRITFSVFEDGDYHLYSADDPRVTAGHPPAAAATDAALLPPTPRESSAVTELLRNDTLGLPPPFKNPDVEPYKARLHLDYFGQPSIAVGADRFGAFAGGGLSFFWSDLLGEHNVGAALQMNSTIDEDFSGNDIGGALMYQNQRHRWHWGVALDQTPYRNGFISTGATLIDGTPVGVEQAVVFRETDRGGTAFAAYPFSRAQRLEFSGGVRNLTFSQKVRTTAYTLDTGEIVFDERQDLETFDPLTLAQTSAALVYDTTSFGATSPVLGQRYRFEVSPLFGTLNYTGVLADYRRYFMPAPLYTIAARVMHYGRYGRDSEDERLFPLFIGYPSLVRGYDVGTFREQECAPSDQGCQAIDRLLGSRMLVANLEFRFPLLRPFGLRENVYGPIPIELAFFADGGVAWTSTEKATFSGADRRAVSSVGTALRVNALGFAVLQFDVSKPLQRPGRGWVFQFSMSPGF